MREKRSSHDYAGNDWWKQDGLKTKQEESEKKEQPNKGCGPPGKKISELEKKGGLCFFRGDKHTFRPKKINVPKNRRGELVI